MCVDEPRGHHVPGSIDRPIGLSLETWADGGDSITLHGDIGALAGGAAAIDESPAPDHERPRHG
jgi:hypothetical protein